MEQCYLQGWDTVMPIVQPRWLWDTFQQEIWEETLQHRKTLESGIYRIANLGAHWHRISRWEQQLISRGFWCRQQISGPRLHLLFAVHWAVLLITECYFLWVKEQTVTAEQLVGDWTGIQCDLDSGDRRAKWRTVQQCFVQTQKPLLTTS